MTAAETVLTTALLVALVMGIFWSRAAKDRDATQQHSERLTNDLDRAYNEAEQYRSIIERLYTQSRNDIATITRQHDEITLLKTEHALIPTLAGIKAQRERLAEVVELREVRK